MHCAQKGHGRLGGCCGLFKKLSHDLDDWLAMTRHHRGNGIDKASFGDGVCGLLLTAKGRLRDELGERLR